MCRHLGYLGPSVGLDELLLRPPHSLLEQTWAPRDMRCGGTINVDGFGAGWYVPGRGEPVRYRAAVPMWADQSFASLAAATRSPALLAAVRSATTGMSASETACAPFHSDGWLFSHNGFIDGWPDSMAKLAATLDVLDLLTVDAPTDSALVWALLRQRLAQGLDPAEAVAQLLGELVASAPGSRINLLLTDGVRLIATTWTHALSLRRTGSSVTIASEPCGVDSEWESIPDGRLVVADREHVEIRPLDGVDSQP